MNRRDLIRRSLATALAAAGAPARADRAVALTPEERAWLDQHPVVLYAPERDFPPFSFVDPQGRHQGLAADVLQLLQESTGLKFQAVAAGARDANIDRLRRREIDLLCVLRPTPEREAYMGFTSSYVNSPAVVLRRREDGRAGEISALGGQRVAVERNSATAAFVKRYGPGAILDEVDVAADALRQVVFGEADAAVVNISTASYLIQRDRLSGLRVAAELPFYSTLCMAYRKDWPLLGRVLEKGLAQITPAGRAELAARWMPLVDLAWWQRAEVQRVLGMTAIGTGLTLIGLLLWNRMLQRAVAQRTVALQAQLAERERLEQRLRQLAEHDALTGLANRATLTEALRRALALASRQKWSVAVVFIDIDKFKAVNDTLGHAAGDALLQQVGDRLAACLRESDLLGRLGGDEFIVVAQALHDGPRNAMDLADKLRLQMKQPFVIEGRPIDIGFSAGIALFPADGDVAETLIARADSAMYAAKRRGGAGVALFGADDEAGAAASAVPEQTA